MSLSVEELELFYKLHQLLMYHVNQQKQIIAGVASAAEFAALPPRERLKVRDALSEGPDLIDSFVQESSGRLSAEELEVVRGWKRLVAKPLYVFRHLKKHTIFLDDRGPPRAYGVLPLADRFEDLLPLPLPVLTQTVLLPFRGRIIYDGLLSSYNMTFGPGIRRRLNEAYQEARAGVGIITALP